MATDGSLLGGSSGSMYSEEEERLLEQRQKEERKEKRKGRWGGKPGGLAITSLMDAMTIILCFLLKSVGAEPINIVQSDDLMIPRSTTELEPEDTVPITVSARGILVGDSAVVEVKDGQVDASRKKGGESGMMIIPLFDKLTEEMNHQKNIAKMAGHEFKGLATIVAHKDTPYRLLTEVMYTAGQAEFANFKFAVVKKKD